MSIAVLRTFISRRREEHEAYLVKKRKSKVKVLEENPSSPLKEETASATEETPSATEETNGGIERYESANGDGGSHSRELKEPLILEVP